MSLRDKAKYCYGIAIIYGIAGMYATNVLDDMNLGAIIWSGMIAMLAFGIMCKLEE
jgi:hypothetical protein